MTTELYQQLHVLAEEAPAPPASGEIIAAVRRRRRTRLVVTATAATLAVALVSVTALGVNGWLRRFDGSAVAGPSINPPATPWLWQPVLLPFDVRPPQGDVPVLPSDRPVGRASLVYRPCPTCTAYLVRSGGEHFRLPVNQADAPPALNAPARGLDVTLSPDGRWLGIRTVRGYLFRDLGGTRTFTVPVAYGYAWSGDSRWFSAEPERPDNSNVDSRGYGLRVDLSDGTVLPVVAARDLAGVDFPSVVTNAGVVAGATFAEANDVGYTGQGPASERLRLVQLDPLTQVVNDRVVVDAGSVLEDGEMIRVFPAGSSGSDQPAPGFSELASGGTADRIVITVFKRTKVGDDRPGIGLARVGGVIASARDGAVLGRIKLQPGYGRPSLDGTAVVCSYQLDPAATIHVTRTYFDSGAQLVSELPAQAYYVLPGMAFGVSGPAYPVS
ncbi:MAG TPA: hypothetical protein VF163_03490 [Micromonosporaceae bacterium]